MAKLLGIVTIVHGENYGNRLQNYALQTALEELGYDVITFKRNIYRNIPSQIKNEIKRKIHSSKFDRKRRALFAEFNNKYIHFSHITLSNRKPQQKKDFSPFFAFICGSDQIWNPNWSTNSDVDFLTFAPKEKRIAYAASFGVEKIEKKDEPRYKKNLKEMNFISVRETVGRQIVYNLTNREVQIVVDPTMLISSEKWMKIEEKPCFEYEDNYVFCYFLAGVNPNVRNAIEKYAKDRNQKIIWFDNKENPHTFENGPSQFLYIIHHASHVFTDSFHCTVFSILFQRQFDVFSRYLAGSKMNDRIMTILKKCELDSRYDRKLIEDEDIDYKLVNKLIGEMVQESKDYLQASLDSLATI